MGKIMVEDQMPDHPKMVGLSDTAWRLDVSSWCYANRERTDGFIPTKQVARLVTMKRPKATVEELLAAGRWEPAEGGYRIHGYLDPRHGQRSAAEIEEFLEKRKSSARTAAAARWNGHVPADASTHTPPHDERNADASESQCVEDASGYAADHAIPMQEIEIEIETKENLSLKQEHRMAGSSKTDSSSAHPLRPNVSSPDPCPDLKRGALEIVGRVLTDAEVRHVETWDGEFSRLTHPQMLVELERSRDWHRERDLPFRVMNIHKWLRGADQRAADSGVKPVHRGPTSMGRLAAMFAQESPACR